MNSAVAHAPWLWPLLRRPMTSYFDGLASEWDERTDAPGVSHLAPLAVADPLKIVQAQYPGHGDMGAMGNRQQTIQQCESRNMPVAEKRCIAKAKTMEDLGECRRASLPPDQKNERGSGAGSAK